MKHNEQDCCFYPSHQPDRLPDRFSGEEECDLPKCKICGWEYDDSFLVSGVCTDCLEEEIRGLYRFQHGKSFIHSDYSLRNEFFLDYFFDGLEDDDTKAHVVHYGINDKAYMENLKEFCLDEHFYDYVVWYRENYENLLQYQINKMTKGG